MARTTSTKTRAKTRAKPKIVTPFTPTEFYRGSYRHLVNRVQFKLRVDRNRAEDLVQEVFVKLFRKMQDGSVAFETVQHALSYCMVAARNGHINQCRRAAKQAPERALDISEVMEVAPPSRDPVPGPSDEEFYLREAVEGLPDCFKQTVDLILDGCSYKEVAKSLGCSVGTVMSRLHRAKKRLKSRLQARCPELVRKYSKERP